METITIGKKKKNQTWAILMMNSRNLGCKPAFFFSLLAMGLERVRKASVPSLKRGGTIVLLVLLIFQASSQCCFFFGKIVLSVGAEAYFYFFILHAQGRVWFLSFLKKRKKLNRMRYNKVLVLGLSPSASNIGP